MILSTFVILIWLLWRPSVHDGINSFQQIMKCCHVCVSRFSLAFTIKSINSLLNRMQWKIFLLLSLILNCTRYPFETFKTKSFIIVWQVCLSRFLISFEKNFSSFFPVIEGDVNLQNLLCKQITHLHLEITMDEYASKTVSNSFVLILSLCEVLVDLELSDVFSGLRHVAPCTHLLFENFRSATLTKLKINVHNFFDCLVLLDGRLDSLSTLIINVADIFDAAVDIGHKVSSRNRTSQWWSLCISRKYRDWNVSH